jgi:hypothetical protein
MNQEVAELWLQPLCGYLYPISGDRVVGFGKLIHIGAPWFTFDLSGGTRTETIKFEDRFRASGHEAREAWFEVIFWKLASTRRLGKSRARRIIEDLIAIDADATELWRACADFVASSSRKSFGSLQDALFIVSKSIPVAATFPAFMRPERFPMVDNWIAKWVMRHRVEYPVASAAAGLVAPSESFLGRRKTTLTMPSDWPFYESWIEFCPRTAKVLQDATGLPWRARDVEMAAFQNARSGSELLPPVCVH